MFQHPGLKALGFDRAFEQSNPLSQVIDGVGPAALFADPELDIGNAGFCQLRPPRACRHCFRRLRCRLGALLVALDAEIAGFLDVVSVAPPFRLERELAEFASSHHLAHLDESAGGMTPNTEARATHLELLDALIPERKAG